MGNGFPIWRRFALTDEFVAFMEGDSEAAALAKDRLEHATPAF